MLFLDNALHSAKSVIPNVGGNLLPRVRINSNLHGYFKFISYLTVDPELP